MSFDVVTDAIEAVANGRDLSADEAEEVLARIMHGGVSEIQVSAFLIGLRTKGETVEEVTGLARTMRAMATRVAVTGDLLDTAGTGGGAATFNVSTTAAFVAAAAGARVAKHGNRSTTSQSGSADVLEALGARIDLRPDDVATCVREVGLGFMFAPAHHSATRHVVPVRKALGVRTVFNFLGPLTNPAGANRQLIGVADGSKLDVIAGALVKLGCERALVVAGAEGLDEVSVSGETAVVDVSGGTTTRRTITPEEFGLDRVEVRELAGGTPAQNAAITRAVLTGESGARRTLVVANAAAALVAAGLDEELAPAARRAEQAIDSGRAVDTLDRFVAATNELGGEVGGMTALDEITRSVRQDIERRREQVALADLERSIAERTDRRPFAEALASPGISLLAEYKRRSPSAGDLPRGSEPVERMVQAYERGGATALSVLTEGTHFGGSLADLRAARAASTLPVLRKDFILDRYQLYEAAAAQADAVLLIVAALDPQALADLHAEAGDLDLDCLVEVHDAEELEVALAVDADVIGVNNRDLRDLSVDLARTFELLPDVPAGKTVVSESGIRTREELDELERVGVDAVLIGEMLMRADDPEQACRDLVGVEGEDTELA